MASSLQVSDTLNLNNTKLHVKDFLIKNFLCLVSALICIIIYSCIQEKDCTDGFLASFAIVALTLLSPFAKTSK